MNYIAVLLNSTIRSTTPILLAALGSAMCSQSGVFNIALEGQILIGCFAAIAVSYFTQSVLLAVLAAMLAGMLVASVVALLQVKYRAADMVVGTSLNLFVVGFTALMLFICFGVRGRFIDPSIQPLPKWNWPLVQEIPFLGRALADLTPVDYAAYGCAVGLYLWTYRTVGGFHMRSVGIHPEAARSLGVEPTREQMKMVILSGALCGLGGAVLSIGQVTMFIENMSSGRGYIAMAAASMGANHPLAVMITSLFFGIAQAVGTALHGTIPSQLTMTIPYLATIVALMITYADRPKRKKDAGASANAKEAS